MKRRAVDAASDLLRELGFIVRDSWRGNQYVIVGEGYGLIFDLVYRRDKATGRLRWDTGEQRRGRSTVTFRTWHEAREQIIWVARALSKEQ